MAIDANRWTQKTQEAFSAAVADARGRNNPEVTPDHFLLALLSQEGTAVLPVLERVGVAVLPLRNRLEDAVSKLPHSYGGEGPALSRESRELLEQAGRERSALGDEYLSVEHILLASAQRVGASHDDLLEALREVRGSHRVTSQNPEESYQALEKYGRDLTEEARRGRLDPVIGRDEEIRRVIQVLSRRTKNNPVLIGEPGVGKTAIVEGLAAPDSRGRRAGKLARQARPRARPRRHGRRRQVPRRVRRTPEGGAEGDFRRWRRGHHLYRRAAYDRRRRRSGRRHGRRQHDKADAGSRGTAADRGHDPR